MLAYVWPTQAQNAPTSAPVFSIITCGPGTEIYELEGHTALRIRTVGGEDCVVNWGIFDFNRPGFVYHFVAGHTDYQCGICPTDLFLREYEDNGRWVVEHVLNLTHQQAWRLYDLVSENLKPENRVYRYRFLTDNCATRPLALIEKAIGSELQEYDDKVTPEGISYRGMMYNYHENYPWYQFGIDIALGKEIDTPITQRQKAFAPIYLDEMLDRTYYIDARGDTVPLSLNRVTISSGSDNESVSAKTPFYLGPDFSCWMIFLLAIALSLKDIGTHRITLWFDAVFYAILGLAGLLVTFLIFVSQHEATSPNWLILWLDPLCLIMPLSLYTKFRKAALYFQLLNACLLFILIVIWITTYRTLNTAFYPIILADIARVVTYLTVLRNRFTVNHAHK